VLANRTTRSSLTTAIIRTNPYPSQEVHGRSLDQNSNPESSTDDHASDGERPRKRQHRSGRQSLADGAAAGHDAADAHQDRSGQMTAHLVMIVEGIAGWELGG
jgi:hypothetical protein